MGGSLVGINRAAHCELQAFGRRQFKKAVVVKIRAFMAKLKEMPESVKGAAVAPTKSVNIERWHWKPNPG